MLDPTHESNKNLKAPTISFVVSVALTFIVYFLAVKNIIVLQPLTFTLLGLGILQAIVQLVFYFQIANEPKPRWNLMSLIFTVLVLIVIIGGSMWIMSNLEYNLMPSV